MKKRLSLKQKVMKRFQPDEFGCWLWTGYKTSKGYGRVWSGKDGKLKAAHRVMWEINFGKIPKGMFVCHSCDVTSCVNPDHLWIGTAKENYLDMIIKGREYVKKGTEVHSAKLSEKNVKYIRKSKKSSKELADMFDCTPYTIRDIKRRETWKHI